MNITTILFTMVIVLKLIVMNNYIRETARRISERAKDHVSKDVNSHFFKHAVESEHEVFYITYYSIIGKGYRHSTRKQNIAEELLTKEIKPTLNRQDLSIALKLLQLIKQLIVAKYLLFKISGTKVYLVFSIFVLLT